MAQAATPGSAQADFVGEEFLRLGADQNQRVLLGVLVASALMGVIAATEVGPWLPGAWLLLVIAAQFARLRVEASVADPASAALAVRLRRRVRIALVCGSVQALALVVFYRLEMAERAFYTVVLLGLATGAVANSAGHMRVVAGFGLPMLVPLVALWSLADAKVDPAWLGPAMGVLIVFYGAVLHGFAQGAWRIFEESCLIRFKETELNAQLKEALAVAEAASRAKTRFLAAASHDLRQPLHTIVLLTSALGLRPLDARSHDIVALLGEVTETLSAQLDDLLDVSKLDAGVITPHLETVPVAQLLAQHFSELEAPVAAKGLLGRLAADTSSCVTVDPQLFTRILRNLTHNALKFTQEGTITLAARDEAGEVVIEVRDTGCGIAPEHQQDVFLEFFQAGNPERDRTKGLGLGLSIVQRLCQLQGIAIALRSQPQAGTCFELRLPRAPAPQPPVARPHKSHEPRSYGLHVLVVDDEVSVRTGMRLLLEELGCSCDEASSTAQACDVALTRRPDLVLSDFRLRGEDSGLKALASLDAVLGGVPGVLVSGDTAPERLREARDGGRRLLHKPVSLEMLREELRAAQRDKLARRQPADARNEGRTIT